MYLKVDSALFLVSLIRIKTVVLTTQACWRSPWKDYDESIPWGMLPSLSNRHECEDRLDFVATSCSNWKIKLEILYHILRENQNIFQTYSEIKWLRVLHVDPQCGFTRGEVAVQLFAIIDELITLQCHYGIHFPGTCILHGALATVWYHRIRNIVLYVTICNYQNKRINE